MRVLLVSNTYPPDLSGVASLVQEKARRLVAKGYSVRVLTRRHGDRDNSEKPCLINLWGPKFTFPFLAGLVYLGLALNPFEKRYDVVHVHESDGGVVILVHWLLRRCGNVLRALRLPIPFVPCAATLQVSYKLEQTQVDAVRLLGAPDTEPALSTPTAKEQSFSSISARVHSWLGRRMVGRVDAVVAPSTTTRGELEKDYGAREVKVIFNGIDTTPLPAARKTQADGRDGRVTILYTGRLRTRKAVAVLLVALDDLVGERNLDTELVIVGGGEQEEALVKQARSLFGPEQTRVRFHGAKPRDDTFPYYGEADIYCLPSLYEGLPVAIIEAMAAGLPVVSTNVSGNPEVVRDEITGLLVEPRDAVQLANALERLILDPALRRTMGEAGRQRVEEEFTIGKVVDDYVALWKDLVPEKRNANTEDPR